jgi:hypothetical protein
VLTRRAQVARLTVAGKRGGYTLYGVAMGTFFVGFATASFSTAITVVTIGSLVVGSMMLAPAIVLGYAVKAADRADRDGSW